MKWQNFELETIQASLITKFGVMTLNKTTQQQIDYCRKKNHVTTRLSAQGSSYVVFRRFPWSNGIV